MNADNALYKGVMMDHYRAPRNHGDTGASQLTARVDNPLCGDDLEVGITLSGEIIDHALFRARGCAICIASGSMMTETVRGEPVSRAEELAGMMSRWFHGEQREPPEDLPETLKAMTPVRDYPTRSRCVLLAWEALQAALDRDRSAVDG